MSTTTSRVFQYSKYDLMLMSKILLLTKVILKSFQKKKEDSSLCHAILWSYFFALVMLCYTLPCFSWHNLHQRQEFWVLQFIPHVLGTKKEIYYSPVTIHCHYSLSLFTCHYSLSLFIVTIHPLLFMTLFTPNFFLFKGGCPLYLKQVLVELSLGLLS